MSILSSYSSYIMSFYVGPERFEPTQRDAQWRNRCCAEVQSYSNSKSGSGKTSGRGRNPILGDDSIHQEKFLVIPNPEKIGAPNAEDFYTERAKTREEAKKYRNKLLEEVKALTGEGVPAAAIREAVASGNANTMYGKDSDSVTGSNAGAEQGRMAKVKTPGSVCSSRISKNSGAGTASTLSGAGSSSLMSSRQGTTPRGVAVGPPQHRAAQLRYPLTSPPASGTPTGRSVTSSRSSVLYEALGEETVRRVAAEKEVLRLEKLLEEATGRV